MPTETPHPEEKFVLPEQRRGRNGAAVVADASAETAHARIKEHWLELPDGRMRYLKAGWGRPLILLHGLMGYSFSWRFTMPALAPYAAVYAIDNLGAGLSTSHEGMDCSVRGTAERVLQFADAMGTEDFDLLGTSHGGGVAIVVAAICAQESAKRHLPQNAKSHLPRLRRLVLVAPVNPWSRHGKRLAPFVGSDFGSLLFRNTIERWRALDILWLRRLFGDESKIPPDSLEGYRIPAIENRAFHHARRIVRNWTADLAEIENALPQIRGYGTLLMWGTKDRAVDFQSADRLLRNFHDARVVAFKGVGHMPYEEAPEDFNRALIDFLGLP